MAKEKLRYQCLSWAIQIIKIKKDSSIDPFELAQKFQKYIETGNGLPPPMVRPIPKDYFKDVVVADI